MGRHRQVLFMLAVLPGVALGACRQEAVKPQLPADGNAPVQTDGRTYRFESLGDSRVLHLKTTYTNRSAAPRYLVKCGSAATVAPLFTLEKLVYGAWKDIYHPGPCPPIDPLPTQAVAPGGRATHAFDVSGALSFDEEDIPRFEVGELPGVYRLTFTISSRLDDNGAGAVAVEERVSNSLAVTGSR